MDSVKGLVESIKNCIRKSSKKDFDSITKAWVVWHIWRTIREKDEFMEFAKNKYGCESEEIIGYFNSFVDNDYE